MTEFTLIKNNNNNKKYTKLRNMYNRGKFRIELSPIFTSW